MRVVFIEIENFRGIKVLKWAPGAGMNCLIGPGDSTKTTILDAIELCLNPRSYIFADDCDFYDLNVSDPIRITITLSGLPPHFKTEDRYGLHLRGWDPAAAKIVDEPATGLDEALSIKVVIDQSLEARWSIHNDRIDASESDAPTVRYKDARQLATNRLGPFAERHLGWGRTSVLTRIGEAGEGFSLQLAEAGRAARTSFKAGDQGVFKKAVDRAEELSKLFAVPMRGKFTAELDVQGVSITSGGISLHDGNLPLRRLGTGSARLLVSALQHDAGPPHIAIIDEIEHGLEPHRVARLLKYLKTPKTNGDAGQPQIFATTHSPVVIRELSATDIFAVRAKAGTTTVASVAATAKDGNTAQRHLRGTPEAFLVRKVLVGEGRTEQGLARGLDDWWQTLEQDSFALQSVVAIDGAGKDNAPLIAEHLRDLGYEVLLLLDSDEPPNEDAVKRAKEKGAIVHQWPGECSTEERLFLDLPWDGVRGLIKLAIEFNGQISVMAVMDNSLSSAGLPTATDAKLGADRDSEPVRRILGRVAKDKNWFKDITRGERLSAVIGPNLAAIPNTPLAKGIVAIRKWVDGG
ncbi:ATP-dependent nuclease [Rhizobium laguerreae]|uniref:ATP-dependent nuclease n=1 Tax=Rhizobium laguerreae TaxID=1076926 RepID=UPI001A8FBC22|nr:ATP-binding protein [Rhizobium laguerreae]MBN9983074.1 AAA family ATPase [Rhizobium laguerreae]